MCGHVKTYGWLVELPSDYIVMAYIVMAHIVIAYIVMACMAMA